MPQRQQSMLFTQKLAAPRPIGWCIVVRHDSEDRLMPTTHERADRDAGTMEECIDEIDAFMDGLERYPPPLLAFALRAHLAALLQAILEKQVWTREHARQFVLELEQEALGVG
jgi:hypothetical protein